MRPELATYLAAVEAALRTANARQTWFPLDAAARRERLLRLGREIGYGLRDYEAAAVRREANGLYSRLVVRHAFDSVGPTLDAAEWLAALRAGGAPL